MNVQEFIEKNLSNAKFDRDFNRHLYLKERLEKQQQIISSEEGGEVRSFIFVHFSQFSTTFCLTRVKNCPKLNFLVKFLAKNFAVSQKVRTFVV